jgi:hypothetical protein
MLAMHMGHMGISPFALPTNEPAAGGQERQIFRKSFIGWKELSWDTPLSAGRIVAEPIQLTAALCPK